MTLSRQLLDWLARSIVVAYLDDCEDRGLKAKTIAWYGWHLERCQNWLAAEAGFSALDLVTADGLSAYFRSTRDLARNTRRHMVAALSAFGGWLAGYGLENPARGLRKPRAARRLPRALSADELGRLLAHLEREPSRERALVLLALDSGLRLAELAALRVEDVDLAAGRVRVNGGKGNQDRVAFIGSAAAMALGEYVGRRREGALFLAVGGWHRGEGVSRDGMGQLVRRLSRRSGVRFTAHVLRHTCATELSAAGVSLSVVADQLGHSSVSTTRLYARLADERRREVVRSASPVDRLIDYQSA
jgi:site-specific recombinase XerD